MTTIEPDAALHADIAAAARIDVIPNILSVVCSSTKMGFAAVARVTEDRWIACAVRDDIQFGLKPGGELKIETTICNEIRQHGRAVVIDDAVADGCYATHATPALYGFRSYISMPIVLPDGEFFGTLCAIDPRPARLSNPETVGMFELFARLIAFHLEAERRVAATHATLLDERRTSELREQFIAVLGHDLRNPLASISAGGRLLMRTAPDDQSRMIVASMQKSVERMAVMIDNVMDFARGRLGGGLVLDRQPNVQLDPVLQHIVDELQSAHADRLIVVRSAHIGPVNCDRTRIGQLVSNLLSNALAHGVAKSPVTLDAAVDGDRLRIAVSNTGDPIPAEIIGTLFQPFVRAAVVRGQTGLGLGLYIASEIARAHGGSLTVASTAEETRFVFEMPIA